MPLLSIATSAPPLEPAARAQLAQRLSALVAQKLGKPERYVMIVLSPRPEMLFGGSGAPACYAELKNVGEISADEALRLSDVLCTELGRGLGVDKDRIYIEFTNADGALWGWNGETFR